MSQGCVSTEDNRVESCEETITAEYNNIETVIYIFVSDLARRMQLMIIKG